MKFKLKILYNGLFNSYSQIFFSEDKVFAGILILASFIDIWAGIAGVIAVSVSILLGFILGFDQVKLSKGLYGFNALLVGLGLGIYFAPGPVFYFVLITAIILTFFLNIALEGIIGKYNLPYLSIPFLIGIWIITLATRNFDALGISSRGIYTFNEMYVLGGKNFVNIYSWWNNLEMLESLRVYFISLGAIFFQYNVLAGILIAAGILYYSRIAFSLSLIGFYAAYCFYELIGANLTDLSYTYIGFNYILSAIAIGGFFLIPSFRSYIWTVVLVPVVALITISTHIIFAYYQLSIYSLPFNIIVLLFLYILKFRVDYRRGPIETIVQHNSPEKNLYAYLNHRARFKDHKIISLSLPFWGEWIVSQAHNGEYTHQDKWKHAWDFVIKGNDGRTYKEDGSQAEHYYCYNKTIIAPADGIVEAVEDGIVDNKIGEVNLIHNWGNTIVIKHIDGLYTKLSHLKIGSITVKKGEFIKKGEVLAHVGNSGRSPEPHLHFQVQANPYVGSETINYPIGCYILHRLDGYNLMEFKIPKKDDLVSNISNNSLLVKAFKFIPGQTLKFVDENKKVVEWKVMLDVFNNSYIYCERTNSYAYFSANDHTHYFKNFKGDRKSLLYFFFLAAFKSQFGYYENIHLKDHMPINLIFKNYRLILQDFIAPFFLFLKAEYNKSYISIDDDFNPDQINIESNVCVRVFGKKSKELMFNFEIDKKGIKEFGITNKGLTKKVKCVND